MSPRTRRRCGPRTYTSPHAPVLISASVPFFLPHPFHGCPHGYLERTPAVRRRQLGGSRALHFLRLVSGAELRGDARDPGVQPVRRAVVLALGARRETLGDVQRGVVARDDWRLTETRASPRPASPRDGAEIRGERGGAEGQAPRQEGQAKRRASPTPEPRPPPRQKQCAHFCCNPNPKSLLPDTPADLFTLSITPHSPHITRFGRLTGHYWSAGINPLQYGHSP